MIQVERSQSQMAELAAKKIAQPVQGRFAVRRASGFMVQDMAEELSFMHSEKLEEKTIRDENIQSREKRNLQDLIKKVQEVYKANEEGKKEEKKQILPNLSERSSQTPEDLLKGIEREKQGDKSAIFARLHALSRADNLPPALRSQADEALKIYATKYGPAIRAGLNVTELANTKARETNIDLNQLQSSYQDMVTDYRGILPALRMIIDKVGPANIPQMARFLREAASVDLNSLTPSGSKARLLHLLSELKGIEIFQSIKNKLGDFLSHLSRQHIFFRTLNPDNLVRDFLELVEKPGRFDSLFGQKLKALPVEQQILFFQGLRNSIRSLPDYLFTPPELKSRAMKPVQTAIDRLSLEEDE